ncbi:unnamed protein product [Dovyalis caffra]|uniref:Uncharacterized protein n=1 Tax=Dovyalis caffra TaxID=77055 RepID=A0AAV1SVU0_9ROSI|nr:unnamed protein product [Dovyalis caffra]
MSRMKIDRKPPLPKSLIRMQHHITQITPGSLTKSQKTNRKWDMEESDLLPECQLISCELRALPRMVRNEIGNGSQLMVGLVNI